MNHKIVIKLNNETETLRFAEKVARYSVCGDFIRLEGNLGMGKTTFARQFIRSLASDDTLAVPSPTFNLVQTYDETRIPVAHVDAYRMADPSELEMLDLDAYFEHGVTLMEWAENVESALPEYKTPERHVMESDVGDMLIILLKELGEDARQATLTSNGTWGKRYALIIDGFMREQDEEGRENFMSSIGYDGASLTPVSAACSYRTYYRTTIDGEKRILMDAPPPIEELEPFIEMNEYLEKLSIRTPRMYEHDVEKGYMLLEDLGSMHFSMACQQNPERQEELLVKAVDVLAMLANNTPAHVWQYDSLTPWVEAQRFTDWYLPSIKGHATNVSDREAFKQAWVSLWPVLNKLPKTTVHMDYHVDNLIDMENGEAGVIDFQDARVGPICMDIACLLEDRFPAGEELKERLINRFLEKLNTPVDKEDFMAGYNICVAHRFLKVTGMLVRLEQRDLRTDIEDRMDQVWETTHTALKHDVLKTIRDMVCKFSKNNNKAA